jgi:hypothetical protein
MSEQTIGGFTVTELAACARREVAQRIKVYARMIRDGKMSRATADRETNMMRAIYEHFEDMKEPKLF